nr:hypothetical protein [Candidatus Sigynarchaeota archaeon]
MKDEINRSKEINESIKSKIQEQKKRKALQVDRFVEVKRIIYNPNRGVPVSPLVYTPAELEERLRIGDDFTKEILQKGVVLYERTGS